MVLFLRSQTNYTIVDCEIFPKDNYTELRCIIDIREYSNFLLKNIKNANKIVEDFDQIQELRGWLWEGRGSNKDTEYMDIVAEVRQFLMSIAKKYDLYYVED